LSHSDRSEHLLEIGRVVGLPNRPRLKLTVAHTVSNGVVMSSCGTRPIIERAAR
jgi:hypothetical protein